MMFNKLDSIDTVISAIPFVIIPEPTATNIVQSCKDNLIEGGNYVQMHYSLMAKKLYEKVFGEVIISWVPLNFPPAFVMVCQNN
jgi:phospholipid N-methyltransferase